MRLINNVKIRAKKSFAQNLTPKTEKNLRRTSMKKFIAIVLSFVFLLAISIPTTAVDAVKSIKVTSAVSVQVGKTVALKVTLTPSNASTKTLTYVSANKKVATVSSTGKITGVSKGSTTVTAYSANKKVSAVCKVTVTATIKAGLKIGYFVSALNNGFHQAHANWAVKYAKQKYGASVQIFDGKSDANVMSQNFDQAIAQGMDMVTLHNWQGESIKVAAQDAIKKGMAITSYFEKIPGLPIPLVLPGEAAVSEQMGKIAAQQWKKAHPDKPIVFVQIGWPDNEVVKMGRTDPFAKGVLSVDPNAKNLGCMDGSKGADAAFKLTQDLIQANPDLNIIYSEAADLTVGVLPALQQLGRGKMKNGVPLTEILCSVDCPENELVSVFDPSCSLKMSMGLPIKETAQVRIDTAMKIYSGALKQLDNKAQPIFVPNKLVGYWSMKPAEAVTWFNDQNGTKAKLPTYK